MNLPLLIAVRFLRSKQKYGFVSVVAIISVLGVFIGTAVMTFALAMTKGFEHGVKSRIVGTTAHVAIYDRYGEGIADYDAIAATIAEHPRVTGVAPFVYYKAAIGSAEEDDGVVVRGIDPERSRAVSQLSESVIVGDYDLAPDSAGRSPIMLGATLAERLYVRVGEEVFLQSARSAGTGEVLRTPRVKTFVVTGIFETGMYEYDASLCYISLADAQSLFLLPERVTGFQVRVDDWQQSGEIADGLSAVLPPYLMTTDWKQMNKNLFHWMELEELLIIVVMVLLIAIAAFNNISTLTMGVMDKRRQIAILKALGMSSRAVTRVFMWQGAIIGAIGTAGGVAAGLLVCWLQGRYGFIRIPAEIYFIDSLPVKIEPFYVLLVLVVALAVTFLAAIYPAWRAGRTLPVEVLRYE